MEKKKEYVQICPKCGSINLKSANFLEPSNSFGIHTVGTATLHENKCGDCGYSGICPEIEKDQLKDFRKKLKKWT